MEKTRIIMLIRNVMPEYYGGGETYQLMLAKALKKKGFSPMIVSSSEKLLREASKAGVQIKKAPFCKRQNWSGIYNLLLPAYLIWQIRLKMWYKKLFMEYKPYAIDIQSRDDWIAATGIAKKMGIRTLWTDHMDFRSWVLQNVNIWYKNLIGKWVLRCAGRVDKVIMISDFERKKFEEMVRPRVFTNLVTIKNGVIDEYEKYKNVNVIKNSFFYLGRVVDYKGIGELICAFNIVNKKYPETVLNIYGVGADIEKYMKKANGNKRIRFYGQVDTVLEAMAKNDVFVLPSYREGLSISLLEATMMGKKIIVSKVDGNPEVIEEGKTGLLVPARNANQLANAMQFMIENRERANAMAKEARKKYEAEFNFEEVCLSKILRLFS